MLVEEQDLDSTEGNNSLIERIRKGQKEAEQELVTQYWRGLYFILKHRSQNPDLAADIAQDTFIVVIQKARNGEILKHDALNAYIRQTGINLLIGHYRKESRRDTSAVADIEIHAPTDDMEISHSLHSEKMLMLVQQLMNELSNDRDRQLLRNYFVYDKSKQQICTELELSAEHFDKVLFRARQRLKQVILHKLVTEPLSNKDVTTILLSIVLVLCINSSLSHSDSSMNIFDFSLRDNTSLSHLTIATPITRSLCPERQITTAVRCL